MPSNTNIPEQKMVDARFLRDEFDISELAIGHLLSDEQTAAAEITEWLLEDGKTDPLQDVPVPDSGPHFPHHDEHMLKPVVRRDTNYSGAG
jgi:hypothetical protein